MYQIARPERDIFAQLFLELSDIISSHHYDALIHKSFISWWLRFLKFHILARFLFFSLIDGRAGPPRILTRAPPPSSPFCLVSQIYFGRFFREPRWSHPTRPVGPKSKGVPCFRSKWGVFTNNHWGKATHPPSRDDPQGRKARFSLRGETRPKVLPIGRLSWFSTEGGKRTSVLKNHSFSCQKLCEAAGRRH